VDGILDSTGRLLQRVPLATGESLIGSGVVKGGMIPKLQACIEAGRAGVKAHIVNGTEPGALLRCLEGASTGTAVV
ncbi:MAG: acetylglutamate kinase, partial [Dehalococcoidia bacterium]